MLIATVSSKGSPGASVSALAMALSWPRPVILVELDPRGGDVLFGYGRGQNVGAGGLLRLQLATRTTKAMTSLVWNEVVELPSASGSKWWMPGLLGPQQASSMDWSAIGRALLAVEPDVDVIADCGSVFGHRERLPRAVWAAADLVVLAVRPTLSGVHVARNAAEVLRTDLMTGGLGPDRLTSFTVAGSRSYPAGQVAQELADLAPLLDRGLPYDPDAADVLDGLRDQYRRFVRSPLMRAAAALAEDIGGRASQLAQDTEPPRVAAAASNPPGGDEEKVPAAAPPASYPRALQSSQSVIPTGPTGSQVRDRGPVREVMRRPIPVPGRPAPTYDSEMTRSRLSPLVTPPRQETSMSQHDNASAARDLGAPTGPTDGSIGT